MESGSKCSCISAPCLPTSFAHGLTKTLESRNIRYKCLAKDWLGLKFIWVLLIWFVWDNFCFPDLTIHVLAVGHWSFDGVWTQTCWWSLAAWLPLAVLVDSHCDMWYLWSCVVKIVWGSHNSEELTEQRKGTKKGSGEDIPYIIHARSSLILSTLKIQALWCKRSWRRRPVACEGCWTNCWELMTRTSGLFVPFGARRNRWFRSWYF